MGEIHKYIVNLPICNSIVVIAFVFHILFQITMLTTIHQMINCPKSFSILKV